MRVSLIDTKHDNALIAQRYIKVRWIDKGEEQVLRDVYKRQDTLNTLLLNCIFASGQLKEGEMYDVDFAHQFIETEKYDATVSYTHLDVYKRQMMQSLHTRSSLVIALAWRLLAI